MSSFVGYSFLLHLYVDLAAFVC
uniref:Uncharacterized protein n=1 Tax=Arundo donax TaxID=35708 RepID=A0A0A8Z7B7_ARUDO